VRRGVNQGFVLRGRAELVLAGCAFQTMRDILSRRPASDLIAVLGLPSEDRVIAGRKVYIWSTCNFAKGTNYKCQVRVILDDKNIIVGTHLDGSEGGCRSIANKLQGM
jgi:hypothetical protein